MLLRRITKHVTDQNWFAVFIDFIIVVVGVFIGIQVSNWNDTLANKSLEQDYKNRLKEDFLNIENRLETNMEFFIESIDSIYLINNAIKQEEIPNDLSDEDFKNVLRISFGSRIPGWQSATYLEMQSAGDISLLQNEQLKKALTEYNQYSEIAHTGWKVLTEEKKRGVQFQIDQYITYGRNANATDGSNSFEITSYDFAGMIESKEFKDAYNT
ncbi:MAG: hypothetical protein AB8B80_10320, partial [Marinicellaceae bacterium]